MADRGRNELCGCGSGLKVKRCCGTARGPSPDQLERAFLADQSRHVTRRVLVATLEHGHDELFAEMLDLPTRHYRSLPLPRLLPPELEHLQRAIRTDDTERFDELIGPALRARRHPKRQGPPRTRTPRPHPR